MIISIDPGVHHHGIAIFDKKTLVLAKLLDRQVFGFKDHLDFKLFLIEEIVIENQQVVNTTRKASSIIDLTLAAGEIVGVLLYCYGDIPIKRYLPQTWKGQTPKEISNERTSAKLSKEERACVNLPKQKTLQHNVWDSIGIGLYHLRRG